MRSSRKATGEYRSFAGPFFHSIHVAKLGPQVITRRSCCLATLYAATLLLTGCATTKEELSWKIANSIVDSFLGYRIQYESLPPGATVSCDGAEQGVAPFAFYRKQTAAETTSQLIRVENCEATWPSGARALIQADIPLAQFPTFVRVTAERPPDVPGYEIDEEAGEKLLSKRRKEYEDLRRGLQEVVGIGTGAWQLRKQMTAQMEPTVSSFSSSFKRPAAGGGEGGVIRWNWVRPGKMDFSKNFQPANRYWTPLLPASSCAGHVVNGQCHGGVLPSTEVSYCVGSFVNGECLGSVIGY